MKDAKHDEDVKCSDHDLLVKTHTVVNRIDSWCNRHDAYHKERSATEWKIVVGLVVSLILLLVTAMR